MGTRALVSSHCKASKCSLTGAFPRLHTSGQPSSMAGARLRDSSLWRRSHTLNLSWSSNASSFRVLCPYPLPSTSQLSLRGHRRIPSTSTRHSLSKKTPDFQCPGPGARTSSTGFPQRHAEHESPVPFAPAETEKLTSFTSHATRMTATPRWIKHDCFA